MRVLIVSCVFPPEPVMSAQTSLHIAERLIQRGHEVTVLAPFPSRPASTPYDGHSRALFRRSVDPKGFKVIRCFSFYSRESRMVSRFAENLSFGLTGGWAAMVAQRPDVIYANTWPIVATRLLSTVARWRGVPLVVSVQDVYPESLEAQGRIRSQGLTARWMRRMDAAIARQCHAVIAISARFADIYRRDRRVNPARVHVIPNWTEPRATVPLEQANAFRADLGLSRDDFVVAYGGNVGVAAGVETAVQAFQQMAGISHLRLVIAGAGSRLFACREASRSLAPGRVIFRTPWPVSESDVLLSMADVLILPTVGRQSLVSFPSKLVAYMLSGRPIVAIAHSESDLATVIQEAGCGWTAVPDRPDLLAEVLRQVSTTGRDELARRGLAGRDYALKHFTRDVCLPRVIDILEEAARVQGAR